MALDPYLEGFCERWREKADGYGTVKTEDWFDRFFTLWVLFNALYTEVALRTGNAGVPDDSAAQDILLHYLTATTFAAQLNADNAVVAALAEIQTFLQGHHYFFKLDRRTGERQPVEDEELLGRLRANSRNEQGRAILEALYCVRCNMFHGHKAFDPVQVALLRPMIVILGKVIDLTRIKLGSDPKE